MVRTVLFSILLSIWLPILVIAVAFARFGPDFITGGPGLQQYLILFALAWPAAIPLTLGVVLLHKRSHVAAYACALVLGILSILAATVGGALGPAGVLGYTILFSAPAWIVLGILRRNQGRRNLAAAQT